jgi:O-antigen/teichoic acid export membrane protein
VLFVLGRDYAGSAIALKLLVWATLPMFMNHALNTLLLAAHKEKVFLWTATICTAFNITANLIFIPRYSFVAAAVVTILTEVLLFLLNFYATTKYFGHPVLPEDWLTITAVFAVCFVGWVRLGHFIPQVWTGALVCTVFAIYGMYAAQGWRRLRAIAGQSQ